MSSALRGSRWTGVSTFRARVHVHVRNGVATLTGTVHLPREQLLAAETVRGVEGIRRVVNQMTLADPINAKGLEPPDTR